MAKMKNDDGKQLSVDEIVSRLKDNISSADTGEQTPDSAVSKTIRKKSDNPDSDIASMLKKFMPETETKDDISDFELEEVPQEKASEFDLAVESDYETDSSEQYAKPFAGNANKGNADFELDDNVSDIADIFIEDTAEEEKSDFSEPIPANELDDTGASGYLTTDGDSLADAVSFEGEKTPAKKKKKSGLFAHKKAQSLADGYAKMLEKELVTESEQGGEPETYADEAEDKPSYADFDMTEMPEINTSESDAPNSAPSSHETADTADAEPASAAVSEDTPQSVEKAGETDPVPTQVYVLETPEEKPEPEEEYYAPDKKPLAFDNDDETPIVPDGSAFENVERSDVSEFENDEPAISENEVSENGSELDDKDINLMMALGYDDELEKTIGKKKVDELSDSLSSEIVDFIDIDNAYAFDGFELNSPEQYRTVGARYKQEHKQVGMRLIGSGIFAFALLIYELLLMFDFPSSGALNIHRYPVVGIMLSLQLLVLSAALSWRQILDGLRDAITFAPSGASLPSFAVLMTICYDIVMALIAPNTGLQLYNFPAALCLFFLVLNDYFNLSREIRAFHTIATKAPKYAVSTAEINSESSPEKEMMDIFAGNDEQPQEKVLDARKVGFVENYFRRSNIYSRKDRRLNLVIFPFLALAIALGIVSFVTNKSGVTAFNISILTILIGMPISMLFNRSYPMYGAAKVAFEKDAAIIGEESVEEYADASAVTFHDSEVFPVEATITRGIKLYDNNAIYYVLYHLTSLYSKIGGPLKTRLEQATAEMGHSEDVQIVRIAEKGVEAVVDGKVHVLAGQAEFMSENQIPVGNDPDDEKMSQEGCSTLYLVLDGVLSAKLYVQYDIDHTFEDVIATLASEKMEAVIYTCDPNIDGDLLAARLGDEDFAARIVKCSSPEENEAYTESAEGGVVARHSLLSLASALTLCNKIRRVRKTSKTVSTVSMVISIIMMIFLALFSSKLGVPSVYVALYQIFWMLPMFLFTKLYVK